MREGWNFTPDKGDRWNESEEASSTEENKPRNHSLRNALIAAGAFAAITSGTSEPQQDPGRELVTLKSEQLIRGRYSVGNMHSFDRVLKREKLSVQDIAQLEQYVSKDMVPVAMQIDFVRRMLMRGGEYESVLKKSNLSEAELSNILTRIGAVSARMTLAYANDSRDKSLKKYFALDRVEAADRKTYLETLNSTAKERYQRSCNLFLARAGSDVYSITAKHCVEGTTDAESYRLSPTTDQAVRYVPRKDYERYSVDDPLKLPVIAENALSEDLNGRVLVNYSFAPKRGGVIDPLKVHFSFAFDMPARARAIMSRDSVKGATYVPGTLSFMTPPAEAKILNERKKPDGTIEVLNIEASGSSGSIVGIFSETESRYNVFTTLESQKILIDACAKQCHSYGNAGPPQIMYQMIADDQQARAQASVIRTPIAKKKLRR